MFRLRNLELVHWDYWQRFTLPLDASIVTIVGPNGSGKTTLLDALRTLLALDCSKKRDYKRYVRRNNEDFAWLRGVVDNSRPEGSSRRPFGILYNNDQVTLVCRIDKKGGDWTRKYWIAEGEVSIEQIESVGQEFGVKDFQRQLHAAGLSPAIAKVLSLEQGQTDKLCELSERELLKLVFEVFGDEEVLQRYQEARHHQELTSRELQETENNLKALENSLQTHEGKVNRHIEWKNLKQERSTLISEIKPRLEFYLLNEEAERAGRALEAGQRERQVKIEERAVEQAEQQALLASINKLTVQKQALELNEKEVNEQLQIMRKDEGRLELLLEQQEALKKQAENAGAKTDDTDKLQKLEQQQAEVKSKLYGLQQQEQQLQEALDNLSAGRRADPQEVTAFRQVLTQKNIGHDTLSDLLEVTDTQWQMAVEAVLAPFAHIILLNHEKDAEVAFSLGETLKYRHLIIPERKETQLVPQGSLLEVIKFSRPVPGWMLDILERTRRVVDAKAGTQLPRGEDWVTQAGYVRERRGGRFAAPDTPRFGRARLEALRDELGKLKRAIEPLQIQLKAINAEIQQLRAQLAGVDATVQLMARAAEFADAKVRYDVLLPKRRALGEKSYELSQLRLKVDRQLQDENKSESRLDQVISLLTKEIQDKENKDGWAEQEKRLERIAHDKEKLPLAWQDTAENRKLQEKWRSVELVDIRVSEIEKRFEQESWETDATIIVLRDKIKSDFDAQTKDLETRRRDNDMARSQTDNAREQYVKVLRHTVGRYTKNLKVLGDMAGIAVEHEAVTLLADDVSLSQAGLVVRFSFDDKGFAGMNDGDASGGQQVMKSLILLVALMMEDSRPGGFVFIDEPFAHLDIFNIKRVASFLQATKAQYLLTTPVTHNVNVYDPSMLTLVTSKKKPEVAWAPRIGVLVREKLAS